MSGEGMKIFYEWTYVGKVPEHVTFEFKKNEQQPPYNENYIVLPLDTKIKTAKELCNELSAKGIMSGDDSIFKWNVQTQLQELVFYCGYGGNGPNLEPGVPYLITVSNEGPWLQE